MLDALNIELACIATVLVEVLNFLSIFLDTVGDPIDIVFCVCQILIKKFFWGGIFILKFIKL